MKPWTTKHVLKIMQLTGNMSSNMRDIDPNSQPFRTSPNPHRNEPINEKPHAEYQITKYEHVLKNKLKTNNHI